VEHLAVLKEPYLNAVITGAKTVECRLSRISSPPFHAVSVGDVIWFKMSRGPVMARAFAEIVEYYDHLTPAKIKKIRSLHQREISGSDEFWDCRLDCRYGSLIWIKDVQPVQPFLPKFRLAGPWLILKGNKLSEEFRSSVSA
jgi:ASC-1-like (ASCH) protein